MNDKSPIILAAGGTGGHIFPAEALAEVLLSLGERPVLVTDKRFAQIQSGALSEIEKQFISAGTIAGAWHKKALGVGKLVVGIVQARQLLSRMKPKAVVGFGGYPSFPTVFAANGLGIPTILHEQNSVLGRANRMLASRATQIATSYPNTQMLAAGDAGKVMMTGNPVRAAIRALRAIPYPTMTVDGKIQILITGGSLGASVFSLVVPAAIAMLPAHLRARIRIDQQCRAPEIEATRAAYGALNINADLAPFFVDVPARLASTHLVIARGGASTVAEMAVAGRPAILVPLPTAMDNHQYFNAGALEEAGGGWVMAQDGFTPASLSARLEAFLTSPDTLTKAAQNARAFGVADAAEKLAALVLATAAKKIRAIGAIMEDRRMTTGSMKASSFSPRTPLNAGIVHFIGIGGIGMSGIAEVLHNLGYKVQGSDASDGYNIQRLKKLGIPVFVGHAGEQIKDASVVVISTAIKHDNPELAAARAARLPIVRRAEMLAELMRFKTSIAIAGTHGKTTTTALVAAMLEAAKLSPTVINGGILNAKGTNAYLGSSEWMVVEADESDGSFLKLPATIAVVTNIDPEHLDHYGTFDASRAAYQTFLTNLPFYGFAVLCLDHPEVQALIARIHDRRVITYGFNKQADVRVVNCRPHKDGQLFDVEFANDGEIKNVLLPMHGQHNASNALAAIAIARELKMTDAMILSALKNFEGVKRRFTKTGEGLGMTVIDDYGHHPVEIAATLKAARAAQNHSGGRVIAVVQPHRYTRVHDLFAEFCTCFNDADTVIVADIYSAGEEPIEGVTADKLMEGLRDAGHKDVRKLDSPEQLAKLLAGLGQASDMVVCLGAGSITKWAYALPDALRDWGLGIGDSGSHKAKVS